MPKSAKEKNEVAVQGTNDSSIVSKCAVSTQGYFQDDYLKHFVSRQTRRAPLINRGYYVRAKAIDDALRCFLKSFQGDANQIVSLGAGFDSAYFRLEGAKLLSETRFYEIDFSEVACRKAAIIERSGTLSGFLKEPVFHHKNSIVEKHGGVTLSSRSYQLLGINLNDLDSLHHFLLQSGCDVNKPTLFLSECVITYMNVRRSDALIEFCASTFDNAVFICYEQIYPTDSFGLVMTNHFKKLGSPLKAIGTYGTPSDHQERYLRLGWTVSRVIDMNEFYLCLEQQERERINKLEPFDEFEEWHLKCNHYILVTATKGSCISAFRNNSCKSNTGSRRMYQLKPQLDQLQEAESEISSKRSGAKFSSFGHCSERINQTFILVHGGFGDKDGCHQRLSELVLMDIQTGNIFSAQPDEGSHILGPRMFHTITATNNNESMLVFGGRTSPTKPCHQTLLLNLRRASDLTWRYRSKVILSNSICPESRWRHTATAVKYNSNEGVLIFGGRNLTTVYSDCFYLCNDSLRWQQVVTFGSVPEPRHSHSANLWQDSVVVACGLGEDERPLGSIYFLKCGTWEWSRLEISQTLTPRYSHNGHVHRDDLLLVGGVHLHGDVIPSVTRINLKTGCWKEYEILIAEPERPLMLHNHTSFIHEEELLIIGGGGNCFSFGTHLNDSPKLIQL